MRILSCVFALVVTIACSDSLSPTSPSPTSPSRASAATALRWDVMATAASCTAESPPSPQPAFSTAVMTNQPDGSVIASWPYQLNGREVTLYAHFIRENDSWAMCAWDTADV